MTLIGKTKLVNSAIFHNNFAHVFYVNLWRLTEGNMEKAYATIRATLKHYAQEEFSDDDLMCILGELNGGTEVEWAS